MFAVHLGSVALVILIVLRLFLDRGHTENMASKLRDGAVAAFSRPPPRLTPISWKTLAQPQVGSARTRVRVERLFRVGICNLMKVLNIWKTYEAGGRYIDTSVDHVTCLVQKLEAVKKKDGGFLIPLELEPDQLLPQEPVRNTSPFTGIFLLCFCGLAEYLFRLSEVSAAAGIFELLFIARKNNIRLH